MRKSELIVKVAERVGGISVDKTTKVVNALFSVISEVLASGDSYSHDKFGSFKASTRAQRKGRNPKTGEEIIIPEKKVLKLTPSGYLKDFINGKKETEEER